MWSRKGGAYNSHRRNTDNVFHVLILLLKYDFTSACFPAAVLQLLAKNSLNYTALAGTTVSYAHTWAYSDHGAVEEEYLKRKHLGNKLTSSTQELQQSQDGLVKVKYQLSLQKSA